jgi:hypothetical protein
MPLVRRLLNAAQTRPSASQLERTCFKPARPLAVRDTGRTLGEREYVEMGIGAVGRADRLRRRSGRKPNKFSRGVNHYRNGERLDRHTYEIDERPDVAAGHRPPGSVAPDFAFHVSQKHRVGQRPAATVNGG